MSVARICHLGQVTDIAADKRPRVRWSRRERAAIRAAGSALFASIAGGRVTTLRQLHAELEGAVA